MIFARDIRRSCVTNYLEHKLAEPLNEEFVPRACFYSRRSRFRRRCVCDRLSRRCLDRRSRGATAAARRIWPFQQPICPRVSASKMLFPHCPTASTPAAPSSATDDEGQRRIFTDLRCGAENPSKIIEAYLIDRTKQRRLLRSASQSLLHRLPKTRTEVALSIVKNIRNDVDIAESVLRHNSHLQQLKDHPGFRSTI